MVFCVLQLLVLWRFVVVCFDLVFWFAAVFVCLIGWRICLVVVWGCVLLLVVGLCFGVVVYIVRLVVLVGWLGWFGFDLFVLIFAFGSLVLFGFD